MILEFKTNLNDLDGRSVFANRILKLIYIKNAGNIDDAIKEAQPYFDELKMFIKNIYELIDTEIPLYCYYELMKYGPDDFGLNEEEYLMKIKNIHEACKLYYQ